MNCSMAGTVLVFQDLSVFSGGHGEFQNYNVAISPWIDLKAAGVDHLAGKVIEFDVYTDFQVYHWTRTHVQWYPEVCANGPVKSSYLTWVSGNYFNPAGCSTERIDMSNIIPPWAEQIRVAIGFGSYCDRVFEAECGTNGNTSPWFDNIRVGVFDTTTAVVAVPDEPTVNNKLWLGHFSPNPFRGTGLGTITFTLPNEGTARVDIFDIAGRLVNTVYDRIAPAGPTAINWTGTDLTGRIVPNGVYFYRLLAGGKSVSRKMVVIRN